MTAKYYAILTHQGAAKLAAATALGTQIRITQMAVGDGNGSLPAPDAAQTQLLNQKRIGAINTLTIDEANTNQIIAEQVIPEDEGGFWIREIGLFDDDNVLIAVASCPETYKPMLQEGSGRTQTIRMVLIVSSTAAVTLKIDPSVVLATRKYVDDKVIEVKAYADDLMKAHIENAHPHKQYLKTDSALSEITEAGLVDQTLLNLGLQETVKLAASAIQRNGDEMVGKLSLPQTSAFGVNTDNTLGGNSIALGDNDTGLKQTEDGVLDIYANSEHVFRFTGNNVESLKQLNVHANIVADGTVYAGNGSGALSPAGNISGETWGGWLSDWLNNSVVKDVRLGSAESITVWKGAGYSDTSGFVLTGASNGNNDEYIDILTRRPIQKLIGGIYYNVGSI